MFGSDRNLPVSNNRLIIRVKASRCRVRIHMKIRFVVAVAVLSFCTAGFAAENKPASGPLRVLKGNPRWFTDGKGRAVYLAGSHTWQSLQDNGLLMREGSGNPHPYSTIKPISTSWSAVTTTSSGCGGGRRRGGPMSTRARK